MLTLPRVRPILASQCMPLQHAYAAEMWLPTTCSAMQTDAQHTLHGTKSPACKIYKGAAATFPMQA